MTKRHVFVAMVHTECSREYGSPSRAFECNYPQCVCGTIERRLNALLATAAARGWKLTPDVATAEMQTAIYGEAAENASAAEIWAAGWAAAPDITKEILDAT